MKSPADSAIVVIAAACVLVTHNGGCEKQPPSKQETRSGAAQNTVQQKAVDWANISPTHDGSEILAYKTLARYCDAWHRGQTTAITLRFVPPSSVADDAGHSVDLGPSLLSPQIWKGIGTRTTGPHDEPNFALASKSDFYRNHTPGMPSDSFGVVPRWKYAMEVTDADTLRFSVQGKYDDGN